MADSCSLFTGLILDVIIRPSIAYQVSEEAARSQPEGRADGSEALSEIEAESVASEAADSPCEQSASDRKRAGSPGAASQRLSETGRPEKSDEVRAPLINQLIPQLPKSARVSFVMPCAKGLDELLS